MTILSLFRGFYFDDSFLDPGMALFPAGASDEEPASLFPSANLHEGMEFLYTLYSKGY